MVLVRKYDPHSISAAGFVHFVFFNRHFFATHCKYVVAKRKRPIRAMSLRTRASFLKTISGPIGEAFKQQEPTPWQTRKTPSVPQAIPMFSSSVPHRQLPSVIPFMALTSQCERFPVSFCPPCLLLLSLTTTNYLLPMTMIGLLFRSPTTDLAAARSPQIGFALSTTISPRVAHYHPMLEARSELYIQSSHILISVRCIDGRVIIRRGATMIRTDTYNHEHTKDQKFGGFPGPFQLVNRLFKRAAPRAHDRFERTMSMDTYMTLQSQAVPWLNFDGLVVGAQLEFPYGITDRRGTGGCWRCRVSCAEAIEHSRSIGESSLSQRFVSDTFCV